MMTGVKMVHVPYRGGAAAITDLLGGQVQVYFDNVPSSIELGCTAAWPLAAVVLIQIFTQQEHTNGNHIKM
jgi:tripartite-type tricarboxylate transporter receptor subunit TctC